MQLKEQMPDLITEMREDLSREGCESIREFFVVSNRRIAMGRSNKPRFSYYADEHDDLMGKLDILENMRLIEDVTSGNTPIYRMSEPLVELVLSLG